MNDLTILIGVLGIVATELVLSATWNRFYFSKGICVFKRQYEMQMREAELAVQEIENGPKTGWFRSGAIVVIHRLKDGEYRFRERFFSRAAFFELAHRAV